MVYSRTQILQKEVFFFELIDRIPREKLTHLKAIVFVRCTDENERLICDHLQDPTFLSYNLCKSFHLAPRVFSSFCATKVKLAKRYGGDGRGQVGMAFKSYFYHLHLVSSSRACFLQLTI
jgi:hypothetical protein